MTSKDKEIWEVYKRGVKPAGRKKSPTAPVEERVKVGSKLGYQSQTSHLLNSPLPDPPREGEGKILIVPLERRREKALREGSVEIDAKLDLHGMTQTEAFAALADFMRKKTKAGKRHLLIITGKGGGGEGVLRANLADWLGQLPEAKKILTLRSAAPKHGGEGAFYLVMRRK